MVKPSCSSLANVADKKNSFIGHGEYWNWEPRNGKDTGLERIRGEGKLGKKAVINGFFIFNPPNNMMCP